MKTLRYFAFAASILAVACAKENNEPVLAEAQEMTFSAAAEDGYTKTGLEEIENGAKVLWLATDKISVFDGANANCEFSTTESGQTAEFSGKAVAIAEGGSWYAVYPYNAANSINGTTISTTLPSVQKVASNAIADGVNVTAAKSATNSFQFKNLCGLIRIAVPAEFSALKSVTINSDKAIAGEFTVDCSGEAPAFASAGADAVKSVTLQKADDSAMTAGNWYVAAFPGTHNISIVLTDNSGKKVILGGNVNVSVKASKIAGVGEVDTDVFTHTTHLVKSSDNLQAAIDAAAAGDRLLLAAGTYKGNFTLKDGVNISGGWNADYTVCDPKTYKTVLDGEQKGSVIIGSTFSNTTTIEGLVIKNGKTSLNEGGGIYIKENTIVRYCEICNNTATSKNGGGISQSAASCITYDCHIHDNVCTGANGAGAYVRGTMYNCILENNSCANNGGGAQVHNGTMYNCTVRNNSANNAGGIRAYQTSTVIANCLISENTANSGGVSGLSCDAGLIAALNCTIVNNYDAATASGSSSALYVKGNGTLKSCIVFGNYTASKNANEAVQVYINHQYTWLKNNAIRDGGLKLLDTYDPNSDGRESDTQTIPAGASIFTDAANGDFTLTSAATMCIDKGNTSIYGFMTTDLAGNSRTVDTIDIGCYEYQK